MKDPLVRSIMCIQIVEEVLWNTGRKRAVVDFL